DDIFLEPDTFRRQLEYPGEDEHGRQAEREQDDEATQHAIGYVKCGVRAFADLHERPGYDDVRDAHADDIAQPQFRKQAHRATPPAAKSVRQSANGSAPRRSRPPEPGTMSHPPRFRGSLARW